LPGTSTGVPTDRGARDPEFRAAVSGDGQSYEVQPNDNFWSISRKIYGAGRYYKALAAHNQQTIPDPKMMRPGVVIATPDAAFLEQRYGDLIPKAAPSDSVTSVSTTQSRKPVESGPSGYFVSANGAPMYRVAENDTLTGIAKTHLGRTSRWVQILEMNRNVLRDGNELKIGMVLRLPADASRVQVVGSSREYR
jgi:nucleoid-associated protein YgaU